ncbi:MAG: large conductance mechanosensitive channel protein MscL [Acidimicrobiales bacterium]
MLKEFRDFITRGNVVDLAVAVVIGTAFTALVTATLEGVILPIIAAIFGEPDLTRVGVFEINDSVFSIGLVLDAVLKFLIIAAAIFFIVVLPISRLQERRRRGEVEPGEAPAPSDEALLLAEIRDLLRTGAGPG